MIVSDLQITISGPFRGNMAGNTSETFGKLGNPRRIFCNEREGGTVSN